MQGNRYLMMSGISNLLFIPSSLKDSKKILMRHQYLVILANVFSQYMEFPWIN